LKDVPVRMIRESLEDIPQYEPPEGFVLRTYRPGDQAHWLRIHLAADKLNAFTESTFREQFGEDEALLRERQFYLLDPSQTPIGTTTAWFGDDSQGASWGRVHWVAIVPDMQGKGLSKPLMSVACHRLRELGHRRAYLTTRTGRLPAVSLYLKFGFRPRIRNEEERAAWGDVASALGMDLREMTSRKRRSDNPANSKGLGG